MEFRTICTNCGVEISTPGLCEGCEQLIGLPAESKEATTCATCGRAMWAKDLDKAGNCGDH